jgi:urease accessory protein
MKEFLMSSTRLSSSRTLGLIAITALTLAPSLALAHLGADADHTHGSGFSAGLMHPFSGLDHLCAMLAVGLWSALTARARQLWIAPTAFAGVLGLGALAGMSGLGMAGIEPVVAASLLVLGLLVSTRIQLPPVAGAALVGLFAAFHGFAHGTELQGMQALAGMLLGTVSLHLIGISLGLGLKRLTPIWSQALGGGIVVTGAVLLAGLT